MIVRSAETLPTSGTIPPASLSSLLLPKVHVHRGKH